MSALSAPLQMEGSELQEDRAYDYDCNSESPLRDAVGSYFK